jgi:hypothetical protein
VYLVADPEGRNVEGHDVSRLLNAHLHTEVRHDLSRVQAYDAFIRAQFPHSSSSYVRLKVTFCRGSTFTDTVKRFESRAL